MVKGLAKPSQAQVLHEWLDRLVVTLTPDQHQSMRAHANPDKKQAGSTAFDILPTVRQILLHHDKHRLASSVPELQRSDDPRKSKPFNEFKKLIGYEKISKELKTRHQELKNRNVSLAAFA